MATKAKVNQSVELISDNPIYSEDSTDATAARVFVATATSAAAAAASGDHAVGR